MIGNYETLLHDRHLIVPELWRTALGVRPTVCPATNDSCIEVWPAEAFDEHIDAIIRGAAHDPQLQQQLQRFLLAQQMSVPLARDGSLELAPFLLHRLGLTTYNPVLLVGKQNHVEVRRVDDLTPV